MSTRIVEPTPTGELAPERVATGESHIFIARRLTLDHRYHDDDPVQHARFEVTFTNGLVVSGNLDGKGKATLVGVPARGEVRYGPDQRPYQRADTRPNPDYRGPLGPEGFDALFEKYRR